MCRPRRGRGLPATLSASFRRTSNILLVSFAAVLTSFHCDVSARAVNISSTWILPQEGFPVFYRYFRDRISWYEADAVCQFHHANLVTVDNTAQYDATRAYLKELDIATYVWVGLSRSDDEANFQWTEQRVLRGDGYWAAAPASRAHCAAADPAADFRWRALPCGGPDIASFVCEIPVSGWARRCSVRALPALTVEWVPERAAVRLTNDCGLAGVRQLYCTGHENQDDVLKNLSCDETDADEAPTASNIISSLKIKPTTEPTFGGRETSQDTSQSTTYKTRMTSAARVLITSTPIGISSTVMATPVTTTHLSGKTSDVTPITVESTTEIIQPEITQVHFGIYDEEKEEFVPLLSEATNNNVTTQDSTTEEAHPSHNMAIEVSSTEVTSTKDVSNFFATDTNYVDVTLHSTIHYIQPSDHFIPALVMAITKMNADMNVLSARKKHDQQISDGKHIIYKTHQFQQPTTTRNTLIRLITEEAEHKNNVAASYKQTKIESPIAIENDTTFKDYTETKKSVPKKYNQFAVSLEQKTKKNSDIDKHKVLGVENTDQTVITSTSNGDLNTEKVLREMQEKNPPTPKTFALTVEKNNASVLIDPNLYNPNENVSNANESANFADTHAKVISFVNSTKLTVITEQPIIVNNGEVDTELTSADVTTEVFDKFNSYQDEPPRPSRSRKHNKISPRPGRLRILGALG